MSTIMTMENIMMMNREAREELYDNKPVRKSSWLSFVKAHKNMRTAKGLLDLKAISKLWKGKRVSAKKTVTRKSSPAKKGSWRLFVKARMGPYMKKYGSHGAAIRQIAKEWKAQKAKGTERKYDPAPRHNTPIPPKRWFYAMRNGLESRSDVKNPSAIVGNIWKKLTPQKRANIKARELKGEHFKYDLPLPDDRATRGTGTLRMVKPFKLAEVQVNLKISDYLAALKSGLFSKMKRNDGSTALVARCKSATKNCNIFVDKVT